MYIYVNVHFGGFKAIYTVQVKYFKDPIKLGKKLFQTLNVFVICNLNVSLKRYCCFNR